MYPLRTESVVDPTTNALVVVIVDAAVVVVVVVVPPLLPGRDTAGTVYRMLWWCSWNVMLPWRRSVGFEATAQLESLLSVQRICSTKNIVMSLSGS